MMTYQNFKETVIATLVSYMPEEYQEMQIVCRKKRYVNQEQEVLACSIPNARVNTVNIGLADAYDDYLENGHIVAMLRGMAKILVEKFQMPLVPEMDETMLRNADQKIVFHLINTEQNRELLADVPHREFLDLSIVYELVKQMNGTIDVNSKPGEGTTFTVKLAFKTVDSAWKKKEIQGENRNITGMNILAAEDNQLNMEILQFLLEEAGAKVTAVSDGKQAVEYFADAASGTYDVILMDIMMPVMDGLEASKKIRELPEGKGKDIPIIAMTANAFVEDKEKTKEAGMNAHLTKPVNREEIIRVLAAYWKNKG